MLVKVIAEEIKDEILSEFIRKVHTMHNCASIVISKYDLPFLRNYNIQDFVGNDLLHEVQKRGFYLNKNLSNENELVFIKA